MPRRPARTKLSRRWAVARPASPELPYLVPPVAADSGLAGARAADGPGSGPSGDGGRLLPEGPVTATSERPVEPCSVSPRIGSNGEGAETPRLKRRSRSPSDESEAAEPPCLPISDGDDSLLPSSPPANCLEIRKGRIVFAWFKDFYHPAVVTRLHGKRVTVKFISDLVKFKKGYPFMRPQKKCLLFTYDEKLRCRAAAEAASSYTAEMALLALDAVELYDVQDWKGDPEEFFMTQCDHIVRTRSTSPRKDAAPLSPKSSLPSPLRPRPLAAVAGGNSEDEDEDDNSEASDSESPSLSPSLPPPPPPPAQFVKEHRAFADRVLEVMLSSECGRHLRALHACDQPSWRRDAFRSGERRRLQVDSSLGELETYPTLAERARREARKLVDQLESRQFAGRSVYAEEVMAPEALQFALSVLGDWPRLAADSKA